MKRIISIILILLYLLTLVGCSPASISDVSTEEVNATVVKSEKFGFNTRIHVRYKDSLLILTDIEIYEKYHDKIGSNFPCVLLTYTYTNGTTRRYLEFNKDLYLSEEKENER